MCSQSGIYQAARPLKQVRNQSNKDKTQEACCLLKAVQKSLDQWIQVRRENVANL